MTTGDHALSWSYHPPSSPLASQSSRLRAQFGWAPGSGPPQGAGWAPRWECSRAVRGPGSHGTPQAPRCISHSRHTQVLHATRGTAEGLPRLWLLRLCPPEGLNLPWFGASARTSQGQQWPAGQPAKDLGFRLKPTSRGHGGGQWGGDQARRAVSGPVTSLGSSNHEGQGHSKGAALGPKP